MLTAFAVIADDLPSSRVSIAFTADKPGRVSMAVYTADGNVQLRSLLVGEWLVTGREDGCGTGFHNFLANGSRSRSVLM